METTIELARGQDRNDGLDTEPDNNDVAGLRVATADLVPGMYVSRLDRPWLGTPFLFQGFVIESDEQLKQLVECCEFVYVDAARTEEDVLPVLESRSASEVREPREGQPRRSPGLVGLNGPEDGPQITRYTPARVPFEHEVDNAQSLRTHAKAHIVQMMRDARLGRSIDTAGARQLVKGMIGSIMNNADALIWMTQLKNRDEYTVLHSFNVSVLALTFGRHLGLDQHGLLEVGLGALLHDIGKIRVSLEILNKPGKLTDREFAEMRKHTDYGKEILATARDIYPSTLDIAWSHHERLQGQGYPRGLDADHISFFSRLVAIVDVYDAITSDRIYHQGASAIDTLKRLYEWRGESLDERLVEAFIQCLGIYPIGTLVELETLEVGVVLSTNPRFRLKPKVLVVMDERKRPYRPHRILDLTTEAGRVGGGSGIKGVLTPGSYGVDIKELMVEGGWGR